MTHDLRTRWAGFALPLLVLAAGSALSLVVGRIAGEEIERRAQTRVDVAAQAAAHKVHERFDAYTEVLVGLRALFNTSVTVTPEQFRHYVGGLGLDSKYPGFQVLNYAAYVPAADKAAFEQSRGVRLAGDRAEYFPLMLIEPLAGNEAALGKDLGAAPKTLEALQAARDSGGLTSSGRKILIRDNQSDIGLAVRLPVYRAGHPTGTVEQRRAAYAGSVGAGFRVAQMMSGIAQPGPAELRVRLFDAGPAGGGVRVRPRSSAPSAQELKADQLLFDSLPAGAAAPTDAFERVLAFELGNRAWALQIDVGAETVISPVDRALPWLLRTCGVAISALVAGILYSLMTSRRRALALAQSMTRHLRRSEQHLEEAQRLASLGSWVLDMGSGKLKCSDEARRIFGFERTADANLASLLQRVPAQERAAMELHFAYAAQTGQRSEFEQQLKLPDGCERWVHVIAQRGDEDGQPELRGTVRDDTQRRKGAQRLRLEHEIAQLLVSDSDPDLVIARALEAVCSYLRWDCGAFWSVDQGLAQCTSSWHGGSDAALDQFARISRSLSYRSDEGTLGRAWASGALTTVDTTSEPREYTREALAAQAHLRTCLVVPTLLSDGSATALELHSRGPLADVDPDTQESLNAIALQLAQYLQRKQAEQQLRYVANHDALTGLANRTALQHDLARAIKRSQRCQKRVGVLFLDIDRFKHINDTLGHGTGDAMIKACGQRLSAVLREDDVVARFGGDEFVLVLENLSQASDAAVVADKVLACCAEPFVIDGRELHMSASIGVSVYPEDGSDGETLLKNADAAMYRAKDKGRGSYQFYAAQMNAQGTERLMLESGLRRALERDELELHYQPKMDLRSQRIVGVEALMRWRHPVLGMVSPAQFIPIAEETGLIEPMGRWALEAACRDARSWQDRGLPPVQVAVNLSTRQLASPTLLPDVAAVLQASRLDPQQLELEITESAMMKNPEHAATLLQQVRQLGVGLAIDDFGTGYSSLSYLKRFPLSTVKIDRSFVNDLSQDKDAQALTDGIITLAHGLRMKVVAEGVETAGQLDYLRARGCDEIQGYWLCKPLPAEEVCKFMARHLRNQFASPVAA
jgi:diguanylate cyclase (GGDEF)-like protein